MFSKLAFKNVGRSMKDYGVWFLTIAFGVCLFYVFNSLETQAVFQYLGSGPQAPTAQAIRELIGMLSVFVWVVLAFLILYASGFLIRRRKGELGTYLLLGMERGQVARLLLLETLCMGVLALLADSTNVERPGFTKSERSVGDSFDALFRGCQQRIIVTTFASNVDRIQQIIDVAARYGRKVAVTGRSMENAMKVSTELGYMNIPDGVLVDLAHIKSLPKHKICIITTGSQGETMSALTRMAFNTHRQVEIQAGDRVILSASAIPGNENAIGSVINELYRKDAEVVNERLGALHVSGHACQEELKIIHALVKPKFFIPVHGEQRHLKTHAKLAQQMGMPPKNILISDIGKVIELTPNSAKINGTVPAGRVFVDGYGVGDVGSVVLRDRKHLAEDGMIVVVVSMSGEDGSVVSGPDIITRGFVYVKESEGLMEELRKVAVKALEECRMDTMNDWASIKSEIKNAISGFLYKKTKRNPMILPVIMEV